MTIKFESGLKYVGQWKDMKLHGYGKLIYNKNSFYQGQFEENLKQGNGIFYFDKSTYYDG